MTVKNPVPLSPTFFNPPVPASTSATHPRASVVITARAFQSANAKPSEAQPSLYPRNWFYRLTGNQVIPAEDPLYPQIAFSVKHIAWNLHSPITLSQQDIAKIADLKLRHYFPNLPKPLQSVVDDTLCLSWRSDQCWVSGEIHITGRVELFVRNDALRRVEYAEWYADQPLPSSIKWALGTD